MPLHPFFQMMMESFAAAGRPALSDGTPEQSRALVAAGRAALGPGAEVGSINDLSIPTRSGAIPARLVLPKTAPIGLVVYLHGGGWVIGELDDYEVLARHLATLSGCAVLLPDYRLAPEHKFPAGLEDCEDALLFAAEKASELCSANVPLVVAGDSAGANLGTVAARRLRGRVDLALQALLYPVTDCDVDRPSYLAHGEGLPLTRKDMLWFFDHYARRVQHGHSDISPLRAPDLSGLPPALIVTAEYDVLRDEGKAYADRLAEAGVPVTHRCAAGLPHGFARLHNHVAAVDAEIRTVAAAIAAACNRARA
ncbi:alpha/beta hydrolase [Bosea sp. NPDC003192]|uniref:alpha/beta hydrolase n=1 Tax=Bosea sp. NPDC003192 TaxID=3390551 RepID=UPI003D06F8DA